MFPVTTRQHPFAQETIKSQFPVGLTISQIIGDNNNKSISVEVGGYPVPSHLWKIVKPKEGVLVRVTVIPKGGKKKILRTILLIGLAVAVFMIPGASFLAGMSAFQIGMIQAGVALAGSLLINALVPMRLPNIRNDGGGDDAFNNITGTSNRLLVFQPIPLIIGEAKVFPPFAAMPFSEVAGEEQYLRVLLDLGHGDLTFDSIKIGDTPIEQFPDVEIQSGVAPTLFSSDYNEVNVGVSMDEDATSNVRSTSVATDEISMDLLFPSGLFSVNDKGNTTLGRVTLQIEFSPAGMGQWLPISHQSVEGLIFTTGAAALFAGNIRISSSARKPFRVGVRWKVTRAQYDVRVTRISSEFLNSKGKPITDSNRTVGSMAWSVLRSIRHESPSSTGTTKLAIRFRATEQLSGVVQQINLIVRQKIRRWTGTAWTLPEETYNPAWIYHWLMTDSVSVGLHLSDSRMDLDSIFEFAQFCDINGFTCKGVLESSKPLDELIRDVLLTGRGSRTVIDGRYGVVWDKQGLSPVQIFTPANSDGFSGSRPFTRQPHAIRMKFINIEVDWSQDEIIVLNDGYSNDGLGPDGLPSANPPATRFEEFSIPFATSALQVWKIGRYMMGQGKFRQNSYNIKVGIENIICTRGDMVAVVNDVAEWGTGSGRIIDFTANSITLDTGYEMPGTPLMITVRRSDNTQWISNVVGAPVGDTRTFEVNTLGSGVQIGDLAILGEQSTETKKLIVTRIEPEDSFEATLTLVDYDERLLTYDQNPPATFTSAITGLLILEAPAPPVIYLSDDPLNSPVDDSGNTTPVIGVNPTPPTAPAPINPDRGFIPFNPIFRDR